jgi:hypothetical protein
VVVWERLEAEIAIRRPPVEHGLAPVIPMARPRTRRTPHLGWLVAAAILVVLVVGGLVAALNGSDDGGPRPEVALAQAAEDAAQAPGARRAVLTAADGRVLATAVMLPDGTGYLTASERLPGLTREQTYQLWAIDGQSVVSLGVLGPRPSVVAFKAAGGPASVALTAEPAGGVVAPSHSPDAAGNFTRI